MIDLQQLEAWAVETQDITAPSKRLGDIYLIVKVFCIDNNQSNNYQTTSIDIIKNIARNSNTSIATLTAIYENTELDFRELVINNPVVVENPNLLTELEAARLYQEEIEEESMIGRWKSEDELMMAMDALDALDKM